MAATPVTERIPLHAAYYADCAQQVRTRVLENVQVARDTFCLRFAAPEIAGRILPGQFLMVRLAGINDPLLGRPLALYDVVPTRKGEATAIDVVYVTLGKMTRRLALGKPGDELDVWGPLGNGFAPIATEHLILVAGGIGQTPMLALGQESLGLRQYGDPPRTVPRAKRVTLCYGVRSADRVACVSDFQSAGFDVRLASDDDTIGQHGLVTDLLEIVLNETHGQPRVVVCCGPEPMMEAVSKLCRDKATRCLVSLETPMACGIGICFSCVAKVRQADGTWDWKRTCVEGPVFDAPQIAW